MSPGSNNWRDSKCAIIRLENFACRIVTPEPQVVDSVARYDMPVRASVALKRMAPLYADLGT